MPQLAQVLIAPLADREQTRFAAGCHLPRYQAEPSRQVSPLRKALTVADRGDQSPCPSEKMPPDPHARHRVRQVIREIL
jgi:hypothetical protein